VVGLEIPYSEYLRAHDSRSNFTAVLSGHVGNDSKPLRQGALDAVIGRRLPPTRPADGLAVGDREIA
jgi:hypothetical protein